METPKPESPEKGVFVVKGDYAALPPIHFTINGRGNIKSDPVILHTSIDMTSYWLSIAFKHLLATETAHKNLMISKEQKNNDHIARYLKKESMAGMETIMASAIAIDAYYASVKEFINIPQSIMDSWREKRTARYKQISEVLRMAFFLKPKVTRNLKDILEQGFKLRDDTVHPNVRPSEPLLHAELNKFVDWRYAKFRFENAKNIYGLSLAVVYKTALIPSPKTTEQLTAYCNNLVVRLKPAVNKWKRRYGDLP
jgi:hypothetical protein